jgi:hypothetical protein
MNYSANKMAAKHCLSAQCIVVDIVPLRFVSGPIYLFIGLMQVRHIVASHLVWR